MDARGGGYISGQEGRRASAARPALLRVPFDFESVPVKTVKYAAEVSVWCCVLANGAERAHYLLRTLSLQGRGEHGWQWGSGAARRSGDRRCAVAGQCDSE